MALTGNAIRSFLRWGGAVALCSACATPPPPPPPPRVESPPELHAQPRVNAPGTRFDRVAFAAPIFTPRDCAEQAKLVYRDSPENGWAGLRGCVERGSFPRGNFTDLKGVLAGPWARSLPTLSDAPQVLAQLIALRGGDIDGDLKVIQSARVPLFSLRAAMENPDSYKGRQIVFLGEIKKVAVGKTDTSFHVAETHLQGSIVESEVAGYRTRRESSYRVQGTIGADCRTGTRGESFSATGSYSGSSTTTRTTYENLARPTGRAAIVRLGVPDPFFEPGKTYVFLARFDGARKSPGAEYEPPTSTAVLTVLSYFPPSPMLVD
jgi:hypothetical protein